jgi:hypothetical protein
MGLIRVTIPVSIRMIVISCVALNLQIWFFCAKLRINMDLTIVLTILQGAMLGVLILLVAKLYAIYRDIVLFVSPGEKGTPSPLSAVVNNVVGVLAKEVAINLKSSIMGTISGVNRGLAGAETEIASAQSPVLGGALSLFPGLRKRLQKNPLLVDLVMQLASSQKGNGSSKSPDSTNTESYASRLHRYA